MYSHVNPSQNLVTARYGVSVRDYDSRIEYKTGKRQRTSFLECSRVTHPNIPSTI